MTLSKGQEGKIGTKTSCVVDAETSANVMHVSHVDQLRHCQEVYALLVGSSHVFNGE